MDRPEPLAVVMRAAQYFSASPTFSQSIKFNLRAPLPSNATSLPPNSALIKISHASLNPVDYKLPSNSIYHRLKLSSPAIPAGDYAGTVVRSTLPGIGEGERVFGRSDPPRFGVLGEYAVVDGVDNVVRLPDEVSFEQAATLGGAGITALQSILPNLPTDSSRKPRVLINGGSGGTGHFGIQIAKILGFHVTTTCSGANVEFCKEMGADVVLDYRTLDIVPHLERQGEMYDLIVDNVCSSASLYLSAQHYLKPTGLYITIAVPPGLLAILRMFVLPSWLGGGQRKAKFLLRKSNSEGYARLAGWMAEGRLKAEVEKVFPLEQAGEVFARLMAGRVRGKIVVAVGE